MIQDHFSPLLSKRMTRKEFLVHVSFVFLALTGITGMVKLLADPHAASRTSQSTPTKRGFGSGPYGI